MASLCEDHRTSATIVKLLILPVLCLLLVRAISWQPTKRQAVTAMLPVVPVAAAPTSVGEMTQFVRDVERRTQNRNAVRCGFLREAMATRSSDALTREWQSLKCEKDDETAAQKPQLSRQERECTRLMVEFDVQPGKSWGKLNADQRERWTKLDCDKHVAGARRRKHQQPDNKVTIKRTVLRERCPENRTGLPLVALCCGTTTRTKQGWIESPKQLDELALFKHLLPSFRRTVDCGFQYIVVVGYDVGDKFWDLSDGANRGRSWFTTEIAGPLLKERNIDVRLTYARVENTVKKPGPVFTAITKTAFQANADYIYRVNDDTELATPWAADFVRALRSLDNVGAVGPSCAQGNRKILTHDFTHRTHMNIFGEDFYYPPALSDWWMDDWISGVYGPERTLRADSVEVVHHTFHHGQRYVVDRTHAGLLDGLLQKGKRHIADYLKLYNPRLLENSHHGAPPPAGFTKFAFRKNRAPPGLRNRRSRSHAFSSSGPPPPQSRRGSS